MVKKFPKRSKWQGPIIRGSTDNFLKNLSLVVDGIASVFPNNCEVVLHDLRKPEHSIIAIANRHVTGRKVGGPIIGGPLDDKGLEIILSQTKTQNIISNYTTRTKDNRKLKSTSIFFRDRKGVPLIALCINLDLTEFNNAKNLLDNICIIRESSKVKIKEIGKTGKSNNDVKEIIKSIVNEATLGLKEPIHGAEKKDKLTAIKKMYEQGLFLVKGGVDYAARALGVSRFTIYNYLKELQYRQ